MRARSAAQEYRVSSAPIGIFGGTFDPIHFGHLRPALEVMEELGLAQVRLVPCHVPPHRGQPQARADHRFELLQIAVSDVPGLQADPRELQRTGPSYTFDTLQDLRRELPNTPLCLIIGMDSLLGLPGWYRWRELIGLAHLVVMMRPGYEPLFRDELDDWVKTHQTGSVADLKSTLGGYVYFHAVTQLDISATGIRRLLAQGRVPRFLVPDAVWQQIVTQRLYGWSETSSHLPPSIDGHDQG